MLHLRIASAAENIVALIVISDLVDKDVGLRILYTQPSLLNFEHWYRPLSPDKRLLLFFFFLFSRHALTNEQVWCGISHF